MRLAVAATAQLGADVLARLAASHEIAFLLTRPDAPRGRGRQLGPPPAKVEAERLGIPVHQPARPELPEGEVDVVVVCAYGLLIPNEMLDDGLWLNVHPSLLPRWRGAAPVERAILAGDTETGVTIHETVEALDAGPIAAQEAFPVGDADAGAIYQHAAERAVALLDGLLEHGVPDRSTFVPQRSEGVTYAEKLGPADRALDLGDAEGALRRVRALSPHIGARSEFHGRPVTVWEGRIAGGRFEPVVVQPDGGRRMAYAEFLRGVRV